MSSTEVDTIRVTDRAVEKLIELRDAEPEGDRLGVRIAILSDEGSDFTYDLSFELVTKAALTERITNHGGLKVMIPAEDVENLEGAELDFELDGLVLRNPNKPRPVQIGTLKIDDELADSIRNVVEHEVNPNLAAHGGFVTFVGHDGEGRAYLTMGGGCHGCSMSRMTMMQGVSTMIKDAVEGVEKVIDVTDHTTGENPYYA